ncbi:MAG: hypothetical protein ABEJ95_05940 [Candidatus Nanohalobium sp.]
MKLAGYLEQVENGECVTYGEIAENNPEGVVKLLENSSVNNTAYRIVVDPSYAEDEMQDKFDLLGTLEDMASTVLDNPYEARV